MTIPPQIWQHCTVLEYSDESELFTVAWDGDSSAEHTGELTRLELVFDAEDPTVFTQRVAAALQSRYEAAAVMRYNFFIDSMPLDSDSIPSDDQVISEGRAAPTQTAAN